MKKRLLIIFLCGVMALGVTGCGKSKNEFDIGDKSDIKVSQNDVIIINLPRCVTKTMSSIKSINSNP